MKTLIDGDMILPQGNGLLMPVITREEAVASHLVVQAGLIVTVISILAIYQGLLI